MSSSDRLNACLDLTRRMPPDNIETTLGDLMFIAEDLAEPLLANIEVPFKTEMDKKVGRPFIITDFNRDGDSYRSPFTNDYYPPIDDGVVPPDNLRKLEIEANTIFEKYTHVYYQSGLSSVYAWEISGGFAVCVLIKKDYQSTETNQQGTWNSSHFFRIMPSAKGGDFYDYNLTSSVSVSLGIKPVSLSGRLVRKFKREGVASKTVSQQVQALGAMVENAENNLRDHIESVYFSRVDGIVKDLRSVPPLSMRASGRMVLPV